jgi:hypothetical protein
MLKIKKIIKKSVVSTSEAAQNLTQGLLKVGTSAEQATQAIKRFRLPVSEETKKRRTEGLQCAREAKLKIIAEGGEVKRKNPMEIWEEDKTSSRKSINANCYDCCGRDNYVNEIRYCIIFYCPFWHIRPYGKGITTEKCTEWTEEQVAKQRPITEDDE